MSEGVPATACLRCRVRPTTSADGVCPFCRAGETLDVDPPTPIPARPSHTALAAEIARLRAGLRDLRVGVNNLARRISLMDPGSPFWRELWDMGRDAEALLESAGEGGGS